MVEDWSIPPILTGPTEDATKLLTDYFNGQLSDRSGPYYTGSMFERFGADTFDPHRVDNNDLISLSMLGVNMPAHASLRILGEDAQKVSQLLGQIPDDIDLADAPANLIDHGSFAWRLWDLIDGYRDVGATLTSKLMARKRPRLIPVQDSVVSAALGVRRRDDFWKGIRAMIRADDGAVRKKLRDARDAATIGDDISELRVFDVVVWSSNNYAAR